MDNDLVLKTLSEIVDVAGEISALNVRNRKLIEELIKSEAEYRREHSALASLVRDLEERANAIRAAQVLMR